MSASFVLNLHATTPQFTIILIFFIGHFVHAQSDSLEFIRAQLQEELHDAKATVDRIELELAKVEIKIKDANSVEIQEESDGIVAYVKNSKNIKLLDNPQFTGTLLTKVKPKSRVLILNYVNEFYEVVFEDFHGYIIDSYVNENPEIKSLRLKVKRSNYTPSRSLRSTSTARHYYKGPRGGCYYLTNSGSKVYVSRSLCN
ncbi:hypothetical protein [Lewinella sp. 4G2]|uniref:hypothetical protein n=1 Tax=Lewinella sp. 4G2 TaxID=1803372 RepID=UPI0007E1ADB0|nr:hypothetical protein [Lewinella sp. 4G2]OAV45068.1 hypothetical protein A3850_011475 [Lewinella sp. 4G2]